MELISYLCRAKKERDGLRHQRDITQTGYRTLPEFAKKETLWIIPQQLLARQHNTVQLTYLRPIILERYSNAWSHSHGVLFIVVENRDACFQCIVFTYIEI